MSSSSPTPTASTRRRRSSGPSGGALCIWEFFYLARPDSRLEGIEVHNARVRMGERLAQEAPVEADLVLPIPDSGTPAAIGFARALGLPFSEGLIKNRYVQRTFIQPDQELRRQGIKLKYHPVAEVAGKRVVAVDDSIVRGNTTREIVRDALRRRRRRGAPPHLLAAGDRAVLLRDRPRRPVGDDRLDPRVEEVREHVGATSLAYLSHDGLVEATQRPASALCRACLTGDYPTEVPRRGRKAKRASSRRGPPAPRPAAPRSASRRVLGRGGVRPGSRCVHRSAK